MKNGDIFLIHVLGKTLAYKVDQIKTVLPEESSELDIIEGEDHVTLVTCTPYGVNTHRLLIRESERSMLNRRRKLRRHQSSRSQRLIR